MDLWFVKTGYKKKSPAASATGLFVPLDDEAYTYERCSLTTAGVVTGATTNMYVLSVSLSFFSDL